MKNNKDQWINTELICRESFLSSEGKVFMYLFQGAERDTWKYIMVAERRRQLLEELKMSPASYYRAITNLKKDKMISEAGGVITLTKCLTLKNSGKIPEIFRRM